MSLVTLVQKSDRWIQKQYTRIGQPIPENHLYPFTLMIEGFGFAEGSSLFARDYLYMKKGLNVLAAGFFSLPDTLLNIQGCLSIANPLRNYHDRASEYGAAVRYNRLVRLPVFGTGAVFVLKSIYDVVSSSFTGESSDPLTDFRIGVGFLCLASSMYLKDQNPTLLQEDTPKHLQPAPVIAGH